jgi:hypothetical protein
MNTPQEALPAQDAMGRPPLPLDEDVAPSSPFQEINERRARVENAELLRHLRGL